MTKTAKPHSEKDHTLSKAIPTILEEMVGKPHEGQYLFPVPSARQIHRTPAQEGQGRGMSDSSSMQPVSPGL